MRKVLETIFNADELLQVVGHAKDGREAVSLAESLKPDVISMDINMPHVDGLQATAEIMTTNPRPIVIVSSESKEGAASTLRALELGAIEFVAKPSTGIGHAHCSWVHARLPCRSDPCATHACGVHDTVRRAVGRIHRDSRQGSGSQRIFAAGHVLHLPRRTASLRYAHRPNSAG